MKHNRWEYFFLFVFTKRNLPPAVAEDEEQYQYEEQDPESSISIRTLAQGPDWIWSRVLRGLAG